MRMSERDLEILAACVIAFSAFHADAGLTSASDISHLGEADLDRGAYLMEMLTEQELRAALADAEALRVGAEVAS
jgi:hypothetical protein